MKASHRIILNTLATYGHSVFGIALSLFSARWVLQALGQVDFGLYGVVGSLIIMVTFLTGGLSVGVGRFYAFSIGRGQNLSKKAADDDLKQWFNTALSLHFVLPFLLVVIGYPIGIHAIENWLTIPVDRLNACIWVFRISLVTAFVNMFSVPFVAMYTAHQYIVELAVFGMLRSCGTFAVAYLLLNAPNDKLITYGIYMMVINTGIPVLQTLRAFGAFEACRLHMPYLFDRRHIYKLFSFVGWKMFSMTCVILRGQGSPILLNLYFGPGVNAAFSVAQRVSTQSTTLSSAMMGAFQPAIITMEGRGDRKKMISTALQVCKFGTLLVIVFVIPLVLEMDYILELWLKNPPQYTSELCTFMLCVLVIDRMTAGHMLAVAARGKIAAYELVQGIILFSALPLMWLFFALGLGPVALGYAFVITIVLYSIGRLVFCRTLLNMSIGTWFWRIGFPLALVIASAASLGHASARLLDPGLARVLLVTAASGLATALLGWFAVLHADERKFVINLAKSLLARLVRRRKGN